MAILDNNADQENAAPPIMLDCPSCRGNIVAPAEMAGQTGQCPFCQHLFQIQKPVVHPVKDVEIYQKSLDGLQGQLRENISQITELRGHISRANMELHRHQLRMKTLTDRQADLEDQISSALKPLSSNS